MKDRIERIKEILKEKKFSRDRARSVYNYAKNLKIALEDKAGTDLVHKGFAYETDNGICDKFKNMRNHELLAITPVFLHYPFRKGKKKIEGMFDEILCNNYSHTIFVDLDDRILGTGSSSGSTSIPSYYLLADIFDKKKSHTLIPILFGKQLFDCYLFERFIGARLLVPKHSYVEKSFYTMDVSIFLKPENKKINLVKVLQQ